MAGLRLERVTKRLGPILAVHDLTLDVPPGSFTTLLGPSGCGKTTTLRMVAGFLDPDAGEIYIGEKPQRGIPPYSRRSAIVFQEYALFPHMTVFDNVAYGLRVRRVEAAVLRRRVHGVLELLGLEGLADRFPHQLSGGQQQRVALARSLVVEPEVLLMDEPLSNLDAKLRVRVRAEIKALQRRVGITTLYVTHDQEEALAISDRVAVMEAGALRQVGTPRDLYYRPADRFVADFVGTANFVAGEVVETRGGRTVVRAGPWVLECEGTAGGRRVTLMLRPEWLSLDAEGEGGVAGVVGGHDFVGASVRYRVRIPALEQVLTVEEKQVPGGEVHEGVVRVSAVCPGYILERT